jgi:hypothetical protein
MGLLSFCQWIEQTGSSTALRESTWGYPVIGALHVLGIAWFGGAVLLADPGGQLRLWKRIGLGAMLLTGALLFWIEPVKCYQSGPFRLKMLLLMGALGTARFQVRLSLVLWLATIFAARWIAYF